jgi:hypothetical protein
MNKLERCILDGAINAQVKYEAMSRGWWLSHGPESFLQTVIAELLSEQTGLPIYVDTSIKRMMAEFERGPGRPRKPNAQRPDISVWYKDDQTLRAAIEVKRAWSFHPIRNDANKIQGYLSEKDSARVGYIIVYSDTENITPTREQKMEASFRRWDKKLGPKWSLIAPVIRRAGESGVWRCSVTIASTDGPAEVFRQGERPVTRSFTEPCDGG